MKIIRENDTRIAKCENCGDHAYVHKLREPERLWERTEAGGEVPAGECVNCGCLAYLVKGKGDGYTLLPRGVLKVKKQEGGDGDSTGDKDGGNTGSAS